MVRVAGVCSWVYETVAIDMGMFSKLLLAVGRRDSGET